ncbi:Ger(x)C family spore germination protein [Pseudalkalibacillus salsuginis]|uniref:Ger(x)C family spore germination protein n=1 Tax=Pseudalkalibacillus salsuginis TaxID=2910972 RepID=UPI001F3D940E|nr:Ger(x)C family spore germination protein [Pseudalkalibacillus salsuginis]MCF6410282.1 Ger(x)C family spore germination protein [Pseudalkalibacillus salsuginis]
MKFLKILCVLFLIAGCSRNKIVEDLKIIESLGYDLEDNKIKGSAAFSVYYDIPAEAPVKLLTAESETTNGIFTMFTQQVPHPIEIGKTRTIVMGEPYAKEGIKDLMDTLVRDPIMGNNATVVISKQDAAEVLSLAMRYPPYHLSDVIEQNIKYGNTPRTNIHTVLNQYFGAGQDVYLPVLSIYESEKIMVDGLGIFKGNKLVMHLQDREAFLIKIIDDKNIRGTYEFISEQNEKVFLKVMHGKRKVSITNTHQKPTVNIKLDLFAFMKDYPKSFDLSKKKDVDKLSTKIEKELNTKIEKLLEEFKKEQVDPLGFGDLVRSEKRDWTQDSFNDQYPNLEFEIETKIHFLMTGVEG